MRYRTPLLLVLLTVALPALADRHSAERALGAARAAVAAAEQANADELARIEFLAAEDELTHVERAFGARDWEEVEYAARRTVADAELAEAVSGMARAEAEARALESDVAKLQAALDDGSP